MVNIFIDLFFLFASMYIIVFMHELGHWFKATDLGYKAELNWFSCDVYGVISKRDDYLISLNGVLTGFIPLFLVSTFYNPVIVLLLLVWYLVGARKDLMLVFRGYEK